MRVGIVAATLCGLASAALGQGEAVRTVREQAAVAACAPLGEVRGSSLLGGAMTGIAYDRTLNEMKEKVAAAGGNHLLLIDMQSGWSGSNGVGEAYRCETRAPAPAGARPRR